MTLNGRELDTGTVDVKAAVGFVPQEIAIYPDLTARENLRFFGKLYDLSGKDLDGQIERVLATIGLADRGDERTDAFSGGMKRRLNIGLGMLNDPALLVLDEPTVGVDPQSRNAILDAVEALASEGMAVLYTTHYMEEAERLCDRVGILDDGSLKAEGTRRELISLVGEHDRLRVDARGDLAAAAAAAQTVDRRRDRGPPGRRHRRPRAATSARRSPTSCGRSTRPAPASRRWRSASPTWRRSSCTSPARRSATRAEPMRHAWTIAAKDLRRRTARSHRAAGGRHPAVRARVDLQPDAWATSRPRGSTRPTPSSTRTRGGQLPSDFRGVLRGPRLRHAPRRENRVDGRDAGEGRRHRRGVRLPRRLQRSRCSRARAARSA